MLERNDLNYQPMTDMTQCASELNQIKSFIFKTIVEYISTCTLSYMFCMFFRCGSTSYMPKTHKQTNYAQEWVEWYKMTLSFRFHFWIVYSRKILVVHCKWKALDICGALCILRLIISFVPVSRQNFRSQTKKYSSNGCTVDFKRD